MQAGDRAFVDALRDDDTSGATAIVSRTAIFLAGRRRDHDDLLEVAEACAAAQPAMAGLRTVLKIARDSGDPTDALRHLVERLVRAPHQIARHASDVLRLGLEPQGGGLPMLTLVTSSASAAVRETCLMLSQHVDLKVCCAESRPKCEGAALAGDLAAAGLRVELFSDAGISVGLPGSQAVVIGADAVGPDAFINKVGSAALCALASTMGIPVYVLAGREKLLSTGEFGGIELRASSETVTDARGAVYLRNEAIFERISRHLVSQFITDAGPIA